MEYLDGIKILSKIWNFGKNELKDVVSVSVSVKSEIFNL